MSKRRIRQTVDLKDCFEVCIFQNDSTKITVERMDSDAVRIFEYTNKDNILTISNIMETDSLKEAAKAIDEYYNLLVKIVL